MDNFDNPNNWKQLDRDLNKISQFDLASKYISRPLVAPGIAIIFMAISALAVMFFWGQSQSSYIIITAAIFGAYMALNIGANDVANNVGPAVGSKALTMGGALVIAALCESAGAILAGGDVVSTISKGIINQESVANKTVFIWAMMAALISSALWVNLATIFGAPVSTTHSVVGGVMGAGIAAAGFNAVNWPTMSKIAASWVISPVLGGIIAAVFLAFIKFSIIYKADKITAAKKWVPVLIGLMAGVFAMYLAMKGLKKIIKVDIYTAVTIGVILGAIIYALSAPLIKWQSKGLENRNKSIKKLFSVPLVISAGLLSFAHGANDVANAVGPLAAIVHTVESGDVAGKVDIPLWVMVIGALGISFGLLLYGPKLIKIVGDQITKLNPMRAYCVALSAAITVIIASWLGLPVSSTHIAVGGVFGVGFFREWDSERRSRKALANSNKETKKVPLKERRRRKLVRRSHFLTIIAAWVITVPAAALLSGTIFLIINSFV